MIQANSLIDLFKQALADKWGYIWGTAGVMWTAAKQQQKVSYMVSNYGADWKSNPDAKNSNYYYAALNGSKWIGHMVADCSGLFTWAFKQLGGSIYHGSNSIWQRYCSDKGKLSNGKRTDGKELLPGTAVFCYNKAKDNRSHIGLYIGDGKVIEAAGTSAGVVASPVTLTKWVEWGELKDVSYGADPRPDPEPQPEPGTKPTLRKGDSGEYVTLAQTKLIQQGYDCGKWGADGKFGAATESAVKLFQSDHGLANDGVIGAKTWDALDEWKKEQYTVTIQHVSRSVAEDIVKKFGGTMTKE